jgi:hypothetical protein
MGRITTDSALGSGRETHFIIVKEWSGTFRVSIRAIELGGMDDRRRAPCSVRAYSSALRTTVVCSTRSYWTGKPETERA